MNIIKFYKYFRQVFGNTSGTILFLSSIYAEFCSLFVGKNLRMERPIGILVENQAIFTKIVQLLRVDRCLNPLPLNNLLPIKRHIQLYGDDFLPLSYYPAARSENILSSFLEDFICGKCGSYPVLLAPIVGFTKITPSIFNGSFMLVRPEMDSSDIPEEDCFRKWYAFLEGRVSNKASLIDEPLLKFSKSTFALQENAWLYASIEVACALSDDLVGNTDFYNTLKSDLSIGLDISDNLADNTDISDLFIDQLYGDATRPSMKMLERSATERINRSEIEKFPLFDNSHYYFSDSLFSDICKKLADIVGADQINQALSDSGIQEFEQGLSRITYTKKITIKTSAGVERKRYHVFLRSLVDREGFPDLADAYNGMKKGAIAANGTDISW